MCYFLYHELIASDSKTRQFNNAVDRIKSDARCREVLGPANKIKAYGDPTSNRWARSRPLAHSLEVDRHGLTHFRMHFNMSGPDGSGIVRVHMVKQQDENELQYRLLSLSVPGQETIYLVNEDAKTPNKAIAKLFGVRLR